MLCVLFLYPNDYKPGHLWAASFERYMERTEYGLAFWLGQLCALKLVSSSALSQHPVAAGPVPP